MMPSRSVLISKEDKQIFRLFEKNLNEKQNFRWKKQFQKKFLTIFQVLRSLNVVKAAAIQAESKETFMEAAKSGSFLLLFHR